MTDNFNLEAFLPYVLNQAAVHVSEDFAKVYKSKYGLLRTQWRVLAHLGASGDMSAKEICAASNTHKTKISRAVAALEKRRWLSRRRLETDRRQEILSLTTSGRKAYGDLTQDALRKTQRLKETLGDESYAALMTALKALAA